MSRFVVDASTLLAGVAGRPASTPALILAALSEASFEAIVCPQLIAEVRGGLAKDYFRRRLDEEAANDIVTVIEEVSIAFPDPRDPERVLRDPADDYLIALARVAGAEAIVTGDRDLLEHAGLAPPAITSRAACVKLGLIERTER